MRRKLALFMSAVLVGLGLSVPASAQTVTGTLIGQVKDSGGGALPGVTVTLSSPQLIGGSQSRTTGAQGEYRFPALPPGTYNLVFDLSGFKPFQREGIVLEAGATHAVDALLGPAQREETVTVVGEGPMVDVKSAQLRETARHINKSIPRPIGNLALLEGAEAHERTLKYRIRFKELSEEEISPEFTWKQTEFLTEFICSTPEMKVFVENNVTLKYAYHDKNGKLVIIISIEPRACSRE